MKRSLLYCIALLACLLLAACPYTSNVPISKPEIKTNPILIGTWQDVTDTTTTYRVNTQGMFFYKIVETHKDNSEPKHYMAYTSKINETSFLNLWEDKEGEAPSYLLYKMEIRNDNSILLIEVTENIDEVFTTSDQLAKFITDNMKNSYFFSKEETELTRIGK